MIANELRVGNWIYDTASTPVRVSEIKKETLTVSITTEDKYPNRWFYLSNPSPIPLTEDILNCLSPQITKKEDGIYSLSSPCILETERCFIMIDKIIICQCRYVHELQNWWWVTFKEELNITL